VTTQNDVVMLRLNPAIWEAIAATGLVSCSIVSWKVSSLLIEKTPAGSRRYQLR